MAYDGLGQRLSMIGFAGGQSLTTQYVMDGSRVLSADASGNVTTYLYGLGPIGQLTDVWAYGLPDGSGTQRQLVDPAGEITLAASYTPWGDALSVSGEGNFTYGYFGGVMDTATGLLYVGNGQYYDPSTGRFLNRNVNPNSANPYVPWSGEPTGALIAPLVLLAMVYSRKKRRGKLDMLVLLLVLGAALGLSLSACGGPTPPPPTVVVNIATTPPAPGSVVGSATITATGIPGVISTPVVLATPCPDITITLTLGTPTPEPTAGNWYTFEDYWIISHYVTALEWDPYFDSTGPWAAGVKGYIPGLDQNKTYNLNWVYGDRGVIFQGQGLSSHGEYISEDYATTNAKNDGNIYFRYGKGGQWGPPRAWQTVATGSQRLNRHDWVKIAIYPDKGPFEVLDTGEQVGESHLDVFIGDEFISTADALDSPTSKVSVLLKK